MNYEHLKSPLPYDFLKLYIYVITTYYVKSYICINNDYYVVTLHFHQYSILDVQYAHIYMQYLVHV